MTGGFVDLVKLSEQEYMMCELAESCLPDEFAIRGALYHLQQAVEKSLKAIILYNGETPEYTHDIDKLATHCKRLGEPFSDNLDFISDSLTMWESKTRYDPYIAFSQKKYDMAKLFYNELHEKLVLAMDQNSLYDRTEEMEDDLSL